MLWIHLRGRKAFRTSQRAKHEKDEGIYTFILARLPMTATQVYIPVWPSMTEDRQIALFEKFKQTVASVMSHK
jgi:hypothetical protein